MIICIICSKEIEDILVTHCIDCGGALCEDSSYSATHCFDCGGLLCNTCDAIGLCQQCEQVMMLEEDLFDEEMMGE